MTTFITARQMGECEAFYKIMPSFHLKDSNVATIMIPTGTKETRSKFMIKVDENMDYNGRVKQKRITTYMINKQQQETKQEQENKTEPGQTKISTTEQQKQRSNNKNKQQQQEDKTSTSTIKQQQQKQRSNNTSEQQKQDTTTKPKQGIKIKGVAITDLNEYLTRKKMERAAKGPKNNNNANSNPSHT